MKQAFLYVALVCAACKGQNASKRPCLREVLVRLATPPVGRSRNDVFSAFFPLLFWFLVHFAHMGVLFQFLLALFWLVGGVLHLNCPHCQYFVLICYICCNQAFLKFQFVKHVLHDESCGFTRNTRAPNAMTVQGQARATRGGNATPIDQQ